MHWETGIDIYTLCSVQFSHSVMSNSLRPHGLQHTRLLCPSLSPWGFSNSCPLRQWCHPIISSSVIPFSSCPQFFPASGSFSVSAFHIRWPKYWSFSFSISPSNEYSGLISFRMDWLDLLAVQATLKSLLQHHSSKSINSSALRFLYSPTLTSIHDYWKNHSFDYTDLVGKVMPLLFNMLSRFIIFYCIRVFKMDLPAGNT